MIEHVFNPPVITKLLDPFLESTDGRGPIGRIDPYRLKKVLVVKLDGIGDMILASPLLRELRANLPQAFLSLVVAPHIVNLVELCPYVNEVIPFSWELRGRWSNLRRLGRAFWLSRKYLRPRRFDLAIVPHWEADWYEASALSYFSGAVRRVGYSEKVTEGKKIVNRGFDHFYTDAIFDTSVKHEVERNLQLLRHVGFKVTDSHLECWTSPHDDLTAKKFLESLPGEATGPFIVFGIGGNQLKRVWPVDNFIEAGSWLIRNFQAGILLVGGHQDMLAARKIQSSLGRAVINMAGLLTLRQTAALIRCSALYLGNDTGPMHMAAANKVPVLEISCHPIAGDPVHVHSPGRFGPWGVSHTVLQPRTPRGSCKQECSAHQAHCILNVTVAEVKAACRKMLETKRKQENS
jgi:ADP-heptose:LPS heptosyltransferase